MSHAYPLAETARGALSGASLAAGSRQEAEDLVGGAELASLETDWLTLEADELEELLEQADQGPGHGFLQHYEDGSGNKVLAVTYWKLAPIEVLDPVALDKPDPQNDHTDDLYFRHGRNKSRRKPKPVDPNQIEMFPSSPGDDS